jgi:hypothetical protein
MGDFIDFLIHVLNPSSPKEIILPIPCLSYNRANRVHPVIVIILSRLHIKPKIHDITIVHDIFLAFHFV